MVVQVLLVFLLLACLTSFGWAMRNFFVKSGPISNGLKITIVAGVFFSMFHVAVILRTPFFTLPAVLAAIALYLLALSIFWWAIKANRNKPLAACFSNNEELHLVRSGPYRFVRHPFYCSYLLTWLAGSVGTLNIFLGLTFVAMFLLYLTAALNEERKFATSSLAKDYESYCCTTGRFFPNPSKLMSHRRSH